MTKTGLEIRVQDIDHCGIIAGICDEMELVEQIDRLLGNHNQEIISSGQVVKAMILNGLGFLSAPLYLFEKFFVGKATEHLLGEGIRPEHLNDDRLGRVLDKLYEQGLTQVFVTIALRAAKKYGVKMDSLHLDSSSFHVDGKYDSQREDQERGINITYGYSRDHRPDLKQFIVDLMCSSDGDVPMYMRVGDGNEADSAIFGKLITEFKQQWEIDTLFVADAALYTAENLEQMKELRWVSRVPATLKEAQQLLDNRDKNEMVISRLAGYRIASCRRSYGGIQQRWLLVESHQRQESDLKQLAKRIVKQLDKAQAALRKLSQQQFACEKDALQAAQSWSDKLPFHQLVDVQVLEHSQHQGRGRPRKDAVPTVTYYQISASLVPHQASIAQGEQRCGLFILATNVLDSAQLQDDDVLAEYKSQQSTERGFRFLKDPLFFTSSVFLNTPERVAALALIMALCLLVYSLGQRSIRQALDKAKETIDNQVGKPTSSPTLRWVFQCFMSIHLLTVSEIKQITNLTRERLWILGFFSPACRKYYLLC